MRRPTQLIRAIIMSMRLYKNSNKILQTLQVLSFWHHHFSAAVLQYET